MENIKRLLIVAAILAAVNLRAQEQSISAADLPLTARTFLVQHFKDKAVTRATVDQDRRKSYEVALTDGTEVEFDENGEWEEVDGKNRAIPTDFLLKKVTTYIAKEYPAEKIVKASKGSRKIEVELSNGLELDFSWDGKFKRIDK